MSALKVMQNIKQFAILHFQLAVFEKQNAKLSDHAVKEVAMMRRMTYFN